MYIYIYVYIYIYIYTYIAGHPCRVRNDPPQGGAEMNDAKNDI